MNADITRRVRGVLFDFDGTLVKRDRCAQRANRVVASLIVDFLKSRNALLDRERVFHTVMDIASQMSSRRIYDRDRWWHSVGKRLRVKGGIPNRLVTRLTSRYWSEYSRYASPYRDTAPTLRYLRSRGYVLGLVTDTDGTRGAKRKRLAKSGILQHFSAVVVAGDDTRHVKPDACNYVLAARKLRLRPSQLLTVGDNPLTDLKGGRALGMITVLVNAHARKSTMERRNAHLEPHFVIGKLAELRKILTL